MIGPPFVQAVRKLGTKYGIGMRAYFGWRQFIQECLFWGTVPTPDAVPIAVDLIRERLIGVEASEEAVKRWDALTRTQVAAEPEEEELEQDRTDLFSHGP
jgi:hypothetical protein